MKKYYNIAALSLIMFGLAAVIYTAYSNSAGVVGKTSTTSQGCDCHAGNAMPETSVSVTSASGQFTVAPNSTTMFTITVSNPIEVAAGIDIGVKTTTTGEVDAGSLSPVAGSNLQKFNNELTHISPKNFSGHTVTFQFTWTAPATPGTYYLRAIANAVNLDGQADNGDHWNWMPIQTLTVASAGSVTLSAPAGGENWCQSSTQNITWTSSGISNVKIDLSSDGGATYPTTLIASTPAASGTWAWNIPAGQATGTQYKVKISDAANPSTSSVSANNFSIAGTASITAQPASQSICTNNPVTFSITTTGIVNSYVWQKNGVNIPGTNNANYTIPSVQATDSGSYKCVVTPACGSPLTSNPAILSVESIPKITQFPGKDSVICEGSDYKLIITATNAISYQWRKDGVDLPLAKGDTLLIKNATSFDAGHYDVIAKGACVTNDTSKSILISVESKPVINLQPVSQTVNAGSKIDFTVSASGTNLTYQWKKNGTIVSGQTTNDLHINSVQASDSGTYICIVTNQCGSVTSDAVVLSIVTGNQGPIINLSHTTIDFGTVLLKEQKDTTLTDMVSNSGTQALNVTKLELKPNDVGFSVLSGDAPFTLQPGETRTITVRFNPADMGNHNASITFTSNAVTNPILNLGGIGGAVVMVVSDTVLNFQSSSIDSAALSYFNIKNNGNIDANLALSLVGTNAGKFNIVNPGINFAVKPGQSETVHIQYKPMDMNGDQADLEIKVNNSSTPSKVKLLGSVLSGVEDNTGIEGYFRIFPNPSNMKFTIEVSGVNDMSYNLSIYNLRGTLVKSFGQLKSDSGSILLDWNGSADDNSELPQGQYMAVLKSGNKFKTFVLQITR